MPGQEPREAFKSLWGGGQASQPELRYHLWSSVDMGEHKQTQLSGQGHLSAPHYSPIVYVM